MTHTNTTAPADREISAKAPLRSKSHRTRCPSYLDVDAVLRDGSTIHVRSALPTDQVGLMAFLEGLSQESRLFRFQGALKDLTGAASGFATVDNHRCLSLIALHGDPEVVVGHGLYTALARDRAEIALAVADGLQGLGLGTILVGYLAESAREAGITTFEADVLPQNHRMISVFRNSGFRIESSAGAGTLSIEFPTSTTPAAVEQYSLREHVASVAALRRVFEPSSIAVIGASRRRGSIGGEVFRNLLDSGFPGPVYAVSPYPVVQSVPAYPSVESISGPVDLAVVVVPAAKVIGVARECARKGVQALIVISSGFNEVGEAGRALQAELLEVCRQAGIRLIGPNCMGVLSTAEGHQMNATFAPGSPPRGNIGFMSQSGALGLAVIDKARSYGLGLSTFASVGNKADISGNDLLEYWEDDPNTDVILLYLESFGNPRRFSRIAR
ncbi:MAG TPA: GNAT family N-acetyltransferase, partial [Candidatus Dormibacteraeota bacterium]|nr:GNAT family N-acetyltransferase [Candidatus Dormibacteraeota bacterium]